MKRSFQFCFQFYFTSSSPSLPARYEPPSPLSPLSPYLPPPCPPFLRSSYLAELDSPSQLLCLLPQSPKRQ
jgi:hypothetical protein